MLDRIVGEGITFDDVLLLPGYSEVVPSEVDTRTRFTRNVQLNIPVCSAAMDTVTEAALAIGLAYEGGIGVIHKNMTPGAQAREVYQVEVLHRMNPPGQTVRTQLPKQIVKMDAAPAPLPAPCPGGKVVIEKAEAGGRLPVQRPLDRRAVVGAGPHPGVVPHGREPDRPLPPDLGFRAAMGLAGVG